MHRLEGWFPSLRGTPYEITSPASLVYNCPAWAVNDQERWWWPDEMMQGYWPSGAPREETLEAVVAAYALLGFVQCEGADREPGFEKIAIYACGSEPTHAARQLPDGRWASKCGEFEDITHENLAAVEGQEYGSVCLILRRPIAQSPQA